MLEEKPEAQSATANKKHSMTRDIIQNEIIKEKMCIFKFRPVDFSMVEKR